MQTQCPHCETQFRITETQFEKADGYVRCSICNKVFNALKFAIKDEQQQSLASDSIPAIDEIANKYSVPKDTRDIKQKKNPSARPGKPAKSPLRNESTIAEPATSQSRKDDFDFFNEDISVSQQRVVPDELRDSTTGIDLSSMLWGAGILLLIASLFLEFAWFNRSQLSQVPELQAWMEKLCLQVECNSIALRDPKQIELIARNIYSHPEKTQALMISITMKNNAEFSQPYPVMQIDFSNIRGAMVAARQFLPTEYLQLKPEKLSLIKPNTDITFTMEIQDPGDQAKTYEFTFL